MSVLDRVLRVSGSAILALLLIGLLIGLLGLLNPHHHGPSIRDKVVCQNNLRYLFCELHEEKVALGRWPSRTGGRLLTGLRRRLPAPDARAFFCLGDENAQSFLGEDGLESWRGGYCSYRGPDEALLRDLIENPDAPKGRVIACDRNGENGDVPHHPDGLCVLYETGKIEFVAWSALEGFDGGPVRVGPRSPDPRFRHLVK